MDNESVILNRLLDKFEDRTPGSNRRVMIDFGKSDIKIPDIESGEYRGFREDMLRLKAEALLSLTGQEKLSDKSVWLNLEMSIRYMSILDVKTEPQRLAECLNLSTNAGTDRIALVENLSLSSREYMLENNKLTGVWGKKQPFLNNFLSALVGINDLHGSSISMRAFSINIYSDSKFLKGK